jgi:glycogen debranching enzyme
MQNQAIRTPGGDLEEGTIHCRLVRRVLGALHDDVTVTSFLPEPMPLRLSFQMDADFADIFQVKDRSTPPRLGVERVPGSCSVRFTYERRDFRRGLLVMFEPSEGMPSFVGAQTIFELVLRPGEPWSCCVEAVPEIDGRRSRFQGDPHAVDVRTLSASSLAIEADPVLSAPFESSCLDLERLAIEHADGAKFIAAGAPWFLTLFGRDTLVTTLMASLLGSWHVEGALSALRDSQARARDDFRDAEPGKVAHELRRGELAHFHEIPHTPYYGTHDAPPLLAVALWNAFRWTGDRKLLDKYLDTARAAMRWCEELGDQDGDGLLEYRTRSRKGYRNQGWKDAGDAILHEDGRDADLPIATVELQGYWYAARLAMAELLEVVGEPDRAERMRRDGIALRARVESLYWMEDAGCYGLAIDGQKGLVRSIASNAGHLLWCGLAAPDRAARVARRLLEDDMFSGFGVRTLSARHRRYNPLSYQRGSVWPHDCALLAAGLARYGLHDEAARVIKAVLDAAGMFDEHRLPELFCGFAREEGPAVPYEKANVPQAWAAAAPVLAVQIFLGLVPDAPNGRCYIAPWLPDWLPVLEVRGIRIGDGDLDVKIVRSGSETRVERARHPSMDVLRGTPAAPLWGMPALSDG